MGAMDMAPLIPNVTRRCGGGIPTINVRMQMVCTFIGTFCKYNLHYAELEAVLSMLLVGG
jgi:hypothetical protein